MKIIADHRELFIDIFFAAIIAVGLHRFLGEFFVDKIENLNSFNFESLSGIFSQPQIIFDMFFFFAAAFWVISHWIFYHELIRKYPYYRWRKFFVDITLFSIMFFILNISFEGYKTGVTFLFLWLLVVWYSFACLWHWSDRGLRPLRLYLKLHAWRLMTFAALLVLLYDPLILNPISPWYRHTVMMGIILAMILWSVDRLTRFLRKDSRYYLCDYLEGCPGWSMQERRGTLELVRYPMRAKVGDKTKWCDKGSDSIIFKCDNRRPIEISAEQIIDVGIYPMITESNEADLVLLIACNSPSSEGTVKETNFVFNLNDQIIASVQQGVKELACRNRNGSLA